MAALSTFFVLAWASSSAFASVADPATTAPSTPPQPVVEQVAGPVKEEVEAHEQAMERYLQRMAEFVKDARDFVLSQEQRSRTELSGNYGRTIQSLIEDEEALKGLAKEKFEAFLKRYPGAEYSPHVMFRLAELYFEQAENKWLQETDDYGKYLQSVSVQDMETVPTPPLKNYEKPLSLYTQIVEKYPGYEKLDGVWYMLGFCYSEVNSAQKNDELGRQAFLNLVERFPKSEFSNDANMRLGQHYFDNNDFPTAIAYYDQILKAGEDARYYDKGLYKLAWSHYKLAGKDTFDEYYKALDLFTKLLDYSRKLLLTKGEESSMEPEAIDYAAISFAEISDIKHESPVKEAEAYFRRVGTKEYEPKIMKKLADVLMRQARNDEAIAAFEYLQKRWPLDPDNPQFQARIVTLHMKRTPDPDIEASDRAKALLAQNYHDKSDWAVANKNNPEALTIARSYIEQSLVKMATDLHLRAQQSNRPEDYSIAADRWKEYLTRFPFADDYYELEWYFADALFKSHRLPEAEREYLQIMKARDSAYQDPSLYRLMQVRRQMLIDKYGKVEARPENAVVERTQTTPYGATITVYMIDDEHKAFIEVADKLVKTTLADPTFESSRQLDLAALYYLPAQILFEYGHLVEARARLEKVIALFPKKDEAAFSAGLVVRSFQDENNLQMVRVYTGKYSQMALGTSEEAIKKKEQFASLEEGAAFQLAYNLIKEEKREEAAVAFLKFREEFPRSEHVPDALFNAANNYEVIGKIDKANKLFEEFINTYPTEERAKGFYFRIATNYASIQELGKAIGYYERLARNFPDAQDAPAALYNAAFLKIGQGDFRGAAEAFEAYATRYPKQADAEQSFYGAGEQWERVGPTEAMAFYRRYLRRFPSTNPDHAMESQYRIIKILDSQGKGKATDSEWSTLASMYESFARQAQVGPAGRKYAAEGEFRGIWESMEQFRVVKYSGNEEKDARMLVETKPDDMKRLQDRCLVLIQKYQDFTWSSAAIYVQSAAYFAYADMLFDAPPPKGFTPEQIDFYKQQLDELRVPVEEKGKNRALSIIEKARDEKYWSDWQTKALELLNLRFPREFPREKLEERFTTHGQVSLSVGPLSIIIPDEKKPGTEAGK